MAAARIAVCRERFPWHGSITAGTPRSARWRLHLLIRLSGTIPILSSAHTVVYHLFDNNPIFVREPVGSRRMLVSPPPLTRYFSRYAGPFRIIFINEPSTAEHFLKVTSHEPRDHLDPADVAPCTGTAAGVGQGSI